MKKYISLLFLVVIAIFSCKPPTPAITNEVAENTEPLVLRDITVEEAAEKISTGEAIFVDVRTDKEITGGIIPGSVHIDMSSPNFEMKLNELDKQKEYVVYCKAGGRSAKACKKMKELGFANINNMMGGFTKWKNK